MHNLAGMIVFWLLLGTIALLLAAILVKFVNRRNRVRSRLRSGKRTVAAVALAIAGGLYFGLPLSVHLPAMLHRQPAGEQRRIATQLTYSDIKPIIVARCVACHSRHPTNPGVSVAPMGLRLDNYEDLKYTTYQVRPLTVASQIMPLYNMTGMTPQERTTLGKWIDAGAPE